MSPDNQTILQCNPDGGLEGLQPMPDCAPASEADGVVDMKALFVDKATRAPYVERSYAETIDDYFMGEGAKLKDWSLGANRNGYRGMADEPLPSQATPDMNTPNDGDEDDY